MAQIHVEILKQARQLLVENKQTYVCYAIGTMQVDSLNENNIPLYEAHYSVERLIDDVLEGRAFYQITFDMPEYEEFQRLINLHDRQSSLRASVLRRSARIRWIDETLLPLAAELPE